MGTTFKYYIFEMCNLIVNSTSSILDFRIPPPIDLDGTWSSMTKIAVRRCCKYSRRVNKLNLKETLGALSNIYALANTVILELY